MGVFLMLTLTALAGDGTCHDAEGQFMTSGGQLMTEKDISKKVQGFLLR
jgi:hypothetical protein